MKILITRKVPGIAVQLLQAHFEVDMHAGPSPMSTGELKRRVKDAAGILTLLTDQIDREIIESAAALRVISNHAVGVDNIDLASATRRGIAVTNTPSVLTDATADFTWALLLAVSRNILAGDRLVRSGTFSGWDPLMLLGADLKGKTLGIVGAGRIGSAVAARSRGWEMDICYFNRSVKRRLEKETGARRVALPELLQSADFVTIHLPLSAETTHLIGAAELALMKPGAYLINTARGAIIDEQALVAALRARRIAGAALDVFEREPDLAAGLAELENVLLAPHIASATHHTRNQMAEIAAQNIIHILQGRPPLSIVNPEVLETDN